MATIKKNQLANIVFPIVDGTDFATIESGITASDFDSKMTKKFFGVNHGNSTAFTSGTISKAIALVRSGIFQQTLKAAETNYDYVMYSFAPANTSLAQQLLVFNTATYDDSDMYSYLSDVASNIVSMVSDLISLTSDIDSQLIVNFSLLSDVDDNISILLSNVSDIESQVNINSSDLDSLISGAYVISGVISNMASLLSDIESQVDLNESMLSDLQSHILSGVVVGASSISDITSAVEVMIETAIIPLGASNISDVASRVWSEKYTDHSLVSSFGSLMSDMQSNLYSAIGGVTATLSSDAMSDIAVEVWAHATGVQVDSRVLVVQSMVSDVESQVDLLTTSDYSSKLHSDLYSAIGGVTASVGASDMSDIASRVWATAIADTLTSNVSILLSNVSDIESQVDLLTTSDYSSKMHSDIVSAIGNVSVVLTASDISDIASAVTAAGVNITASDMSDIASRVWATSIGAAVDSGISDLLSNLSDVESQVDLNASLLATITGQASVLLSDVSNVESQVDKLATSDYLSQVHSDLASAIGGIAASVSASDMSDIASRVWGTAIGTRVDSRILVAQSSISDIDSQLTENYSLLSDIDSQMTLDVSTLSDIYSLVSNVESQLDLTASVVSDIDSQLLITHSLLSDVESAVDGIWTTAITEAYAADGAVMTPAQALYMIWANTAEFAISGTTLTVKKLDGSTGAMTFTLDDNADPTSRTRAS